MNIFLTGASGFIGGTVALRLKASGHRIRGLVRSPEKAARLQALGIKPVLGDLSDTALLAQEAKAADAVVNAASSDDRSAVDAFLDALAGSGKPFLHTSGTSVVADDAQGDRASDRIYDEDTPIEPVPGKAARVAIDRLIIDAAGGGLRSVVLCNSLIYGTGRGLHPDSVQIPALVAQAADRHRPPCRARPEHLVERACRGHGRALRPGAGPRSGRRLLLCRERRGLLRRGRSGDRPAPRSRRAAALADRRRHRHAGLRPRRLFAGLEQPGARQARAGGAGLVAQARFVDRLDRERDAGALMRLAHAQQPAGQVYRMGYLSIASRKQSLARISPSSTASRTASWNGCSRLLRIWSGSAGHCRHQGPIRARLRP